jgi:hypothetical protein
MGSRSCSGGRLEVLSGPVCGGRLCGMALRLTQAGDGLNERSQTNDKSDLRQVGSFGVGGEGGQMAGGVPQFVPCPGGSRNAAERCTCGPVVGVGRRRTGLCRTDAAVRSMSAAAQALSAAASG